MQLAVARPKIPRLRAPGSAAAETETAATATDGPVVVERMKEAEANVSSNSITLPLQERDCESRPPELASLARFSVQQVPLRLPPTELGRGALDGRR